MFPFYSFSILLHLIWSMMNPLSLAQIPLSLIPYSTMKRLSLPRSPRSPRGQIRWIQTSVTQKELGTGCANADSVELRLRRLTASLLPGGSGGFEGFGEGLWPWLRSWSEKHGELRGRGLGLGSGSGSEGQKVEGEEDEDETVWGSEWGDASWPGPGQRRLTTEGAEWPIDLLQDTYRRAFLLLSISVVLTMTSAFYL